MIDLYVGQFDEAQDTITIRVGLGYYVGVEKLYRTDAKALADVLYEFVQNGSKGFGERNVK